MSLNQSLIAELQYEAAGTRKSLERVKEDTYNYQPHAKSMTLIRLAAHLAEIPGYAEPTINLSEIDFGKMDYKSPVVTNNKELLELFEKSLESANNILKKADDEILMAPWTAKNNDVLIFTMPRIQVIRSMILNHIIHHRAQLGVYLRMNDVALPSIYGPSADEQ